MFIGRDKKSVDELDTPFKNLKTQNPKVRNFILDDYNFFTSQNIFFWDNPSTIQ